ncbi:hypothetical protein CUC08_Gglean011911 [Alternaria sp. MG1]|nr:hypothetical protein CUC08_Gglean011911 [Alternaria sp. MG1]
MLLDQGADVNTQGGRYGNALQAASERGHEQMVKMLLDAGADVSAQGGYYDNALHTVCNKQFNPDSARAPLAFLGKVKLV